MASINFEGSETKWSTSLGRNVTQVWHTGPTMTGGGTLEASRNGSTISGTVKGAWSTRHSGSFGFPVYIKVYAGSSEIASYTTPTGGNWSGISFGFSVDTNDAVTISVQYVCGQPGGCTKATYPMKNNSLWFESYNPWSPPDTSGFYGYAQSEGASQDMVVKPDGTIHCWCGGLSGGAGNGTYHSYSMYMDVTRGNQLIVDNMSIGDGTDFRFKPWDKYQARPGDLIYIHAVGYTKNEGGGIYQLIDRDVTSYSPITVYKDGAIYLKDGSNKREIVGAYLKDSNGNRVKLSNIKIKDGSNKRSIDLYTTQYE